MAGVWPTHLDELGGGACLLRRVGEDEGKGLGVEGHASALGHEDVVGNRVRGAQVEAGVVGARHVLGRDDVAHAGGRQGLVRLFVW